MHILPPFPFLGSMEALPVHNGLVKQKLRRLIVSHAGFVDQELDGLLVRLPGTRLSRRIPERLSVPSVVLGVEPRFSVNRGDREENRFAPVGGFCRQGFFFFLSYSN